MTMYRLKFFFKRVHPLAKRIIRGWKYIIYVWLNTLDDVAATSIGSSSGIISLETIKDDDHLPSAMLDEGTFFTTHTT